MVAEACGAAGSFLVRSTNAVLTRRVATRCSREAGHEELDALRKWPVGEPNIEGGKKGGFTLPQFPIGAPVHRDVVGYEWTDADWLPESEEPDASA